MKITTLLTCLSFIILEMCSKSDFNLDFHRNALEEEGDNIPSWCADGYNGPTGDIQVDAFCQEAFILQCSGGYDANSAEVLNVCNTFEAFDPSYSCPYCP